METHLLGTLILAELLLRADLSNNAAFQLSNLPDPISSAMSEIILPFSHFKATRNTSLPAVIKREFSNSGREKRAGLREARAGLTLSSLLPPPHPGSCRFKCHFPVLYVLHINILWFI